MNKITKEDKIVSNIFVFPLITLVVAFVLIMSVLYFSLQNVQDFYTKNSSKFMYEQNENFAKNVVLSVAHDISLQVEKSKKKTKKLLKQRIDDAQNMIDFALKEHPDASKEEIKDIIKTILGGVRYNNGRGYYFAYDNSSKIVMIHPIKKMIGKDMSKFKDYKGNSQIKINNEALKRGDGEGFFSKYFFKPNDQSREYEKINYIRYIKELDWVIGTGEYVDEMTKSIKSNLIDNIINKRYGENGYLWIHDSHYTLLAHPFLKDDIGKNEENLTNTEGVKVVKLLVDSALKNPEGAFVRYSWYKPSIKTQAKKVSFVKYIKDLDWVLGTGVYVDDIEFYIKVKKEQIEEKVQNMYFGIFFIFLSILFVAIVVSLYLSKNIKNIFHSYSSILELRVDEAVKENEKKDKLLQEQSKLAAMGEMIGAIAHQWRQPLNTLSINIQNLEILKEDGLLEDDKFVQKYIEDNNKIIYFMSKTIDDFRNFFKIDKEKNNFSIKESITQTANLLMAQLKNNNIELQIEGDDFSYFGFQNEFKQVIINIINNAKDALLEQSGKKYQISIKIDASKKEIIIKDNAGGVPEKILDRIFEPYFTTKEQNKGTGLGLYICKTIIEENMQGKIKVTNSNDGAVFIIELN